MGVLDYDHASDRNPIKVIDDLRRRIDELERSAPTGFFRFDASGTGASGTIMNPPGRLNLPASYDFALENYPLTLSRVVSLFCAMPHVIGVWPMAIVRRDSATDQGRDATGAGNHLTNLAVSDFGVYDYAPYVEFNGSSQSLYKNDGGAANWADVLGTESHVDSDIQGLTFGCWCYFDGLTGNSQYVMSKYYPTNGYKSFDWYRDNSRVGAFDVSSDGNNLTSLTMGSDTIADETWTFVVCRFEPSDTMTMFVSGAWYQNASSIPASIFDSACPLTIGSYWYNVSYTGGWMDGRVSLAFLCAAALTDAQIEALYHQSRKLFRI